MSICDYNTKFKGVNSISQDLLLNILESNFKMFFDWAFLNIGAWFDATSTFYNNTSHNNLILVEDPSYEYGSVWQGIRKDWVWESGVSFNDHSPININNSFISNGFNIDYPLGRVILDDPVLESSNINLDYSYRYVQIYRATDTPWLSILQYSSYETNNADILQTDSGDWSIGGNHRIQLPCIIIEPLARSRSLPYEIGNNNLLIEQDIAFHILAENQNDRNKLLDILRLQQDMTIWLFDTNELAQNDEFPLDYNGSLKSNALNYPSIIEKYKWRKCFIKNVNLFDIDSVHTNLYRGFVKITTEIISE